MVKNAPKRRFKGFNDEWEDKKLGLLAKITTGKLDANAMTEKGRYDFYTSGIDKYKIDTAAFEGPAITIAGNGATVGYMHLVDGFFNAYQRTYVINRICANRIFLFYSIGNILPQKINKEVRSGNIPYIVLDMLTELKLFLPLNNEQQKIGAFFQKLDKQISLYDQKVNKLNNLKKSYLNRMFLKDNMLYPELRFKGFNDEWEEKKLGEFAKITMGESPSSLNYTNNPSDFILIQGNADLKKGRVIPRVWTTQITKKAFKKDIILTVRAPVGDVGITDYDVVIGRGVAAINGNNFLFHLLTMWKDSGFWNRLSTGSTFDSINLKDIQKLNLKIPSLLEQQRIGSFFSKLDTLINLYQDKYHKLKDLKKAYLNEMFVN